ncbi:CDP-alcohol phosphatidyltransferase family protein [Aureitalea sp. L0-47]|uniref:CDP-alcohol phosphatidyltransferase family protein n=1 Tax=Aureitalea sp. L0-47 TaxID=2816962 RepID=UPI002238D5F4|nr:CDP-alcohol phosphatidyltransferase family protein [Aureitalea sp. L0-47]MCW5519159.1 CDP-alcohol phosphatidyltransferase family protein [Aureitalea sp. L0-47]
MVKQIPNIITSLNILCGCVAILFAISGDLVTASFFVFTGIFFDFFDGLASRWLKAHSKVGLQLDSLADVITSGVAPAIVMVQLLSESINDMGIQSFLESTDITAWSIGKNSLMPLVGLLIAVAAAYRLAKFNVDTRQSDSFIGLPTPANAIMILSLPLILHFQHSEQLESIIMHQWFLLGMTVFSCIIMNAEVRLFALKFKTWDLKSNGIRYLFLVLSAVALVFLKFLAIPVIIVLYFLLSLFRKN